MGVVVLPRVFERHPELSREDVESAWENRLKSQYRIDGDKPYIVAIGVARSGRAVELISFDDNETVVIFHAFTPPTKKLLDELGLL